MPNVAEPLGVLLRVQLRYGFLHRNRPRPQPGGMSLQNARLILQGCPPPFPLNVFGRGRGYTANSPGRLEPANKGFQLVGFCKSCRNRPRLPTVLMEKTLTEASYSCSIKGEDYNCRRFEYDQAVGA